MNDRNITNARFIQVNQLPQINSHLTDKVYVDNSISFAIDESSLLRLDPDEKMKQDSILLNSTLTSAKTIIELPTKNYVVNKFNDPSIITDTHHVGLNEKNLDNIRFVRVNNMPAVEEHLTPKNCVDNAICDIISYVDNLYEINRIIRDLSSVFNYQDNEFDINKLTDLDSVVVNRDPSSDNELANRKLVDDSTGEGNVLVFNQTLENYLKVSAGNDTYSLSKNDKIQITDTTIIKYPNTGSYLLQNWVIKCNDKNGVGKIQKTIKRTKTNSPTSFSGA